MFILPMCFLRQAFGNARVALGVAGGGFNLATQYPALRVDFLHRQLHAVFEVGTGSRAATGEFDDVGNLDGLLCVSCAAR